MLAELRNIAAVLPKIAAVLRNIVAILWDASERLDDKRAECRNEPSQEAKALSIQRSRLFCQFCPHVCGGTRAET